MVLDVSNILVATCEVASVTSFCVGYGELVANNKGVIRAAMLRDVGPTFFRLNAPGPGNGSQTSVNITKIKTCWSGLEVTVKKKWCSSS